MEVEQSGSVWALLSHQGLGTGQEQPFLRVQRTLSREEPMPVGIVGIAVPFYGATCTYCVFIQIRCLCSS